MNIIDYLYENTIVTCCASYFAKYIEVTIQSFLTIEIELVVL